jgi:glycosyltransferase involved in cell wall biosynthesis
MMEKMIAGQFPSARIEVSGSGAELDWSVKHLENGITDILCVAAFEPHKRQKDIVEAVAMAKLDDVRVHFVGEGRLKKEIGRLAKERKVEALFHGEVSEKRLGELYSIADVSVFVPELQPWGIFPLESILARIPTILSDQCGVAEIMEKGVPIVRSRDVESLSSVIADAAADRDRYIRDAEDTRKKIERDYNWAKYTERMLGTFRRALQSPEPDREKV